MASHKLTPAYLTRVDRFAITFPAACEFLRLVDSEGPKHGLWCSRGCGMCSAGFEFPTYRGVNGEGSGTERAVSRWLDFALGLACCWTS